MLYLQNTGKKATVEHSTMYAFADVEESMCKRNLILLFVSKKTRMLQNDYCFVGKISYARLLQRQRFFC